MVTFLRENKILLVPLFIVLGVFVAPNSTSATVTFDASTESHTGAAGHSGSASFSFQHTPVGVPKGVLVFVYTISATKTSTSVTYNGRTMTEVSGGAAVDTANEPGRVDTYFLGSGIIATSTPGIVVVNRTNNAVVMYAVAITVTAESDTNLTGIVLTQENAALTEQNVDDGSPGTNSVRFAGGYYGGNAITQGSNSTLLQSIAFGAFSAGAVRETTAGQGSRAVGFANSTDDRAVVHLAIRDEASSAVTRRMRLFEGSRIRFVEGRINIRQR